MIASRAPRFFGTLRMPGQRVPDAPHDPRDRVLLRRLSGWEVRRPVELPGSHTHGGWQFWQPDVGLSVLTPSHLTAHTFEVVSIKGWKVRVERLEAVATIVKRECALSFVTAQELDRIAMDANYGARAYFANTMV